MRAHAHPPSPRLPRRALPPPPPRPADHVADRAPSSPAPSPVVECVESKRLGAGRAHEPRACALGRSGLRTGGGGEWGVGSEGGVGVWTVQSAWGRLRPGRVDVLRCGSREMVPRVAPEMRACHYPVYCARPAPRPPTPTSTLLGTLVPRPPAPGPPEAPGPLSEEASNGILRGRPAQRGKEGFQRRDTRGLSWEGGATGGDRKGAGAKSRASTPLGDVGKPHRQSWKLFSHVVAQRVAE